MTTRKTSRGEDARVRRGRDAESEGAPRMTMSRDAKISRFGAELRAGGEGFSGGVLLRLWRPAREQEEWCIAKKASCFQGTRGEHAQDDGRSLVRGSFPRRVSRAPRARE